MSKFKLIKFESANIEYKEAKQKLPEDIYKVISAFANSKGGIIILGIKHEKAGMIRQGVVSAEYPDAGPGYF